MINNKKGDMSINMIVVATIALIVLVVIVAIFVNKSGTFAKETNRCRGNCLDSGTACEGTVDQTGKCFTLDGKVDDTKTCCISLY